MRPNARRSTPLAALALALAGSCGDPEPPRWIALGVLPVAGTVRERVFALDDGREVLLVEEDEDLWLEVTLRAADWRPAEQNGVFRTSLPILSIGQPRSGTPYRLSSPDRGFDYEPDLERFGDDVERFTTDVLQLLLCLEPGSEPPETCELWACANYEGEPDPALGMSQLDPNSTRFSLSFSRHHARIQGRRMSGDGFWTVPGEPRTVMLDLPPESRLGFATVVEAALGSREARFAPHTFRVRLDGAIVFEYVQAGGILGESCAWHEVLLPRGGARRVRLTFESEGPFAYCSFLAPTIGPASLGSHGARTWADPRPDLIVFLADTFRADNLSLYGGAHGLAPELDRFARGARAFRNAWSTSTHTLPAHSSIFSGVFPHQNGQVDYWNPLPAEVETLAEILGEAGYRCGAITDGVMVSQSHGLDQGFEWFDERRETPLSERVRAFLEADDGRPLFLFVQTYAVHTPYVVSQETRAELGERLHLEHDFETLFAELESRCPDLEADDVGLDRSASGAAELVQGLRDLYLGAVHDLDRAFGAFLAELEARGLGGATLVFTSDHGEAFFEHGRPFHAGKVFEEELRVPLLVRGPGFEPGVETSPVSLVDLTPTLARLAGVEPRSTWTGRSLLEPEPSRAIYAFQARGVSPTSSLAVIEGTRKLIGFEDLEALRAGELHAAFDLERDPGERTDLARTESWPAERLHAHRARLEELLTPLVTSEAARLTAEQLRAMHELGYGGGR